MNIPKRLTPFSPLLLLILILFTAGCRTLWAPSSPSKDWIPPKWESRLEREDAVWTSIRAQKIDTSRPLTLFEFGDIALKNNPNTRMAWEKALAAEASLMQADSAWYPKVTGTSDLLRTKTDVNTKADSINQGQWDYAATVSYLVFDFGGRLAKSRQAAQGLLTSNFQFNQAVQDLLQGVGTAYYELYSAQATVEAAKADLVNAKVVLTAAQKKFGAGLVSKLDVLQAESQFYNYSYALEDARGKEKTARANLAKAAGLAADTEYEIISPEKYLVPEISNRDVSALIEEGMMRRPDIAAARASLRAKEEAVRAASSDLGPTLNYGASATRDYYEYFNSQKAWGDDNEFIPFQLSAKWDLFDGLKNLGKLREAEANLRQEREKLKAAELAASADVWIKYYNFRTAVRKKRASQAYVDSSTAFYELALEGYNAGLKNMLDLVQAESDLSTAKSKLITSKKDVFVAILDVAHALGALNLDSAKIAKERIGEK